MRQKRPLPVFHIHPGRRGNTGRKGRSFVCLLTMVGGGVGSSLKATLSMSSQTQSEFQVHRQPASGMLMTPAVLSATHRILTDVTEARKGERARGRRDETGKN
jgi:hypothetical protein